MEFFLNIVWLCLACLSVCLWLRYDPRTGAQRRLAMIALGMLLLILFPVISVSDDLWSIQNPAETDTCLRRSELASSVHHVLPAQSALPTFTSSPVATQNWVLLAPAGSHAQPVVTPGQGPVENRPPPVS